MVDSFTSDEGSTQQGPCGSDEQQRLIEELTEANRRLEEYSRLKAEFVANMSHELRTPLTAIIGFTQLVGMSPEAKHLPEVATRALDKILKNARHLLALIDDVLDVAKIEAGRMKIHREHVDLAEVVESAFGELQSLARQKGLGYRLSVAHGLPLALTDPLRVRQVVINLLSNAIKFTPAGTIEVELLPWEEDRWRLVVRDTGIGIDERSMSIIFERFRQVDGSMSRVVGGAGLGLSIVGQIVGLLGGTVEVESKVGQGSTFTVTMPLVAPEPERGTEEAAAPAETTEPGPPEPEAAAGADKPLVLVIEDDADNSTLLSETITAAGYAVRVASSGAQGLHLARELAPAAITLDIMMPGLDGWRVLQALKAERRTAQIPVVVCSIVENRPLGYRLGASAYLVKPIEPATLAATLAGVVASRRSAALEGVTPAHG